MQFDKKIYDKIYACWMGKNIGGTLGGPYEGTMSRLSLTGLPDIGESGPLPNDDLDLQLLNLHVLEERGLFVTATDFSEEWVEHVYFPYDEYGYALANIRKKMVAPLSGYYNNPFTDCMGSPIRSELWAVLAPGEPDIAAYYAYQDAMVDHAGGEGMYGEVFFAVLESMAFEEENPIKLIEYALSYIPKTCRVYNAVSDTLEWYKKGVAYKDVRELILKKYDSPNFTDSPLNLAFTIVGLLYGCDFGDALLKTVNLGYDTDCTVATLGSILGIIHGTAGIPASWYEPVGEDIVISPEVRGFDYPKTISELTDRTIALNAKLALENKERFKFNYLQSFRQQNFSVPPGSNSGLAVSVVCEKNSAIIPGKPNDLTAVIENKGCVEWQFQAKIDEQVNSDLCLKNLKPGEKCVFSFTVSGKVNRLMTAEYRLSIERFHDNQLWKSYDLDFSLPVSSLWRVDGKDCYCDGGLVEFSGKGKHLAETTVSLDSPKTVKLICAGTDPLQLSLDGKKVLESNLQDVYIPAFHRCPDEQYAVLLLDAGRHKIVAETESVNELSKIMLLPVAPESTEQPGNHYYYIDCSVGIK